VCSMLYTVLMKNEPWLGLLYSWYEDQDTFRGYCIETFTTKINNAKDRATRHQPRILNIIWDYNLRKDSIKHVQVLYCTSYSLYNEAN